MAHPALTVEPVVHSPPPVTSDVPVVFVRSLRSSALPILQEEADGNFESRPGTPLPGPNPRLVAVKTVESSLPVAKSNLIVQINPQSGVSSDPALILSVLGKQPVHLHAHETEEKHAENLTMDVPEVIPSSPGSKSAVAPTIPSSTMPSVKIAI